MRLTEADKAEYDEASIVLEIECVPYNMPPVLSLLSPQRRNRAEKFVAHGKLRPSPNHYGRTQLDLDLFPRLKALHIQG
jgi:hypothetical protein